MDFNSILCVKLIIVTLKWLIRYIEFYKTYYNY